MVNTAKYIMLALFACSIMAGCDPVTRHKVVTTIFDGVPSLPPPEQFCQEYAEKRIAQLKEESKKASLGPKAGGSIHPPYEAKECNSCHDKTKEGGLIRPKKELCFVCHTNFIRGEYVHGPVAAADCLACHEPHSSSKPKLLKADPAEICGICHREKRVAASMHDKLAEKQMICIDCHDPHFGNVPFFLK